MKRGDTLVEVVVALAILSLVILVLVRMTTVSINNAVFARNQASATKYAQEMLEEMRSSREKQGNDFFKSGSSECQTALLAKIGIFTRSRNCQFSANKVTVTVIVGWTDAKGQHQSQLATEFTPWQ